MTRSSSSETPTWWPDDDHRRQFIVVAGTAVALLWGVRAIIALEQAGVLW